MSESILDFLKFKFNRNNFHSFRTILKTIFNWLMFPLEFEPQFSKRFSSHAREKCWVNSSIVICGPPLHNICERQHLIFKFCCFLLIESKLFYPFLVISFIPWLHIFLSVECINYFNPFYNIKIFSLLISV